MSLKSPYLTKSRFKIGMECSTKLFYTNKKKEYADNSLADSFLKQLAEGGFQVGELAKFLFCDDPVKEKITIEGLGYAETNQATKDWLTKEGKVVIAEGAFQFEDFFIRADIIVKEDKEINLYEVKAKSWDSETDFWGKKEKKISSKWLPYLQDVAFQKYVLQKAKPGYKINAHLILADKSAFNEYESLNQQFKIIRDKEGKPKVKITEGLNSKMLENIPLKIINVDKECDWIYKNTNETFNGKDLSFEPLIYAMTDAYKNDERISSELGKKCKSCQYTLKDKSSNLLSGFNECWTKQTGFTKNDLAKPLSLELWSGKSGGKSMIQKFIEDKKFFLSDLQQADYAPKEKKENLNPGMDAEERRTLQIEKARNNDTSPYLDIAGLRTAMAALEPPFHFIDFETSMVALPFHKGRKPYEAIAFQYSYHIMEADGRIRHESEYLSLENTFPNYDFLRALKKDLNGKKGTIFRYHNHENTYLGHIYEQLIQEHEAIVPDREELIEFIKRITHKGSGKKEEWRGEYDMKDLYDWVLRYYYSPFAKGSNSIKQILPSVINDSEYIKRKYSQPIYGTEEIPSKNFTKHTWITADSKFDPYKTLPPVIDGFENDELEKVYEMTTGMEDVSNGGAAMAAYSYLQFADVPLAEKERIRKALLRYCELDTMAMIMIWEYWRSKVL